MAKKKTSRSSSRAAKSTSAPQLYTVEIFLTGGSLGGEFEGRVISRNIQIRGEQTLDDLQSGL